MGGEGHLEHADLPQPARVENYRHAITQMITREAGEGGEQVAGDYIVAYVIEPAMGLYGFQEGQLVWRNPLLEENVYVMVLVCDAADYRFVPGLNVAVTLIDGQGQQIGTHRQAFVWHPWVHHYGRNWAVPRSGLYRLLARIEPALFCRRDERLGARYVQPVEVEFLDVMINIRPS